MNEDTIAEIFQLQAEFCKSLADAKRLMILHELREGERSVSELSESLGFKQSNTSQHLAVLRKAGVIVPRRESNIIYYSLVSGKIGEACDLVQEVIASQLQHNQILVGDLRDG